MQVTDPQNKHFLRTINNLTQALTLTQIENLKLKNDPALLLNEADILDFIIDAFALNLDHKVNFIINKADQTIEITSTSSNKPNQKVLSMGTLTISNYSVELYLIIY